MWECSGFFTGYQQWTWDWLSFFDSLVVQRKHGQPSVEAIWQATTFHPRKIPKLLQTVAQKVGDFLNSSTIDMALTRDLYKVLTPPCKQFSPWDWLIPYSMIIRSSIQAFEQNTKQIKIAACGVSSSCPRDNVCNKQPTTSCVCCKTWSEWVNLTKDFCAAWTLTWILGQIVSGVYNDGVRVKLHEQDVTLSL